MNAFHKEPKRGFFGMKKKCHFFSHLNQSTTAKIFFFFFLNQLCAGAETYGAYGPQGMKLDKQIGKKIQEATGEKLSTFYLLQSISMVMQ